MEHQEVIDWLRYCDENNIKPWEWDFKNCYSNDLTKNNLHNILKYKSYNLTDRTEFCITGKSGRYADCDKEALHLYQILGWQNTSEDIIRGEAMNSFITTFNEAIRNSSNFSEVSTEIGITRRSIPTSTLYENKNNLKFEIVQNNLKDFNLFAKSTHTIGNFTVLPNWMNCGRGMCLSDYWDITLMSLQEFLNILSPEAWPNFIKKYYLQPYVNTDYNVELFWDNHNNAIKPTKEENFQIFLKKVNERIEERGKFIIKQICDKLDHKDFNFYKEIKNMDTIRFSNEF